MSEESSNGYAVVVERQLIGPAMRSHPFAKLLKQRRIACGWRPLLDGRLADPLQISQEQPSSTPDLPSTGAGISSAVTPTKMPSEVSQGLIIQIRDRQISAEGPPHEVLGRTNMLARRDLGIATRR